MTKDEVRDYIKLHGDAETVIDTIKQMRAEGVEVTEAALDERLSVGKTYEEPLENSPKPLRAIFLAILLGSIIAVAGFAVMKVFL